MNSLVYNVKQGFTQILRNRGMSVASIFSILAMLFILGILFVIVVNLNLFTEVVKQDYDQIEVYLKDEVTVEQAETLMGQIKTHEGAESVSYRSKDDALNIMKQRWGESAYLLDSLGDNPLPASILISVDSMENAQSVSEFAIALDGVEDVQYFRETVEKLTKVTNFLQVGAIVVMVFLIIVSVVVVSNTIKLTVFAHSKEIKIMKYVGATNWFIRGPFLAEGIIIGLISAAIAVAVCGFAYSEVVEMIGQDLMAMLSTPMVPAGFMIQHLVWIFGALGISIGACGSIISMRKFLDA